MTAIAPASQLYERVKSVILPAEWSEFAPDVDAINQLKREKNAVLLAHYYQEEEIQDLADFVGDSLDLSRKAQASDARIIAFAGVRFMAETAKILNPTRKVVLPDYEAGCSLENSCPPEMFRAWREAHPGAVSLTYINCSAEVKAMSDLICTSANAVAMARQFDGRPLISHARSDPVPGEEVFALGANLGPAPHNPLRPGQSAQQQRAVPLDHHPPVQQDHHPDVGPGPDQPAEALLELEGGMGQQVPHEAVLTLFGQTLQPGRGQGLRRNLER